MAHMDHESKSSAHGQGSTAGSLAVGDARIGLAKLELTELERKQARWALARGTRSIRSFSNWAPGFSVLIYFAGVWIANTYVDPSDRVTLYLAYVVSALTWLVVFLGWTVRNLSRRLDAVTEIIEQQK